MAGTTIRTIESETDYHAALAAIGRLLGAKPGTPASTELKKLVALVRACEAPHRPVDKSASVDELRQRIASRPTVNFSIPPAEVIRQMRDSQ
ncbi:MAG: hypothetical protein OXC10_14645 [Rhodospirillaceae bacterium]|nr:hypothetical protein [Rhodospirillaceae bacterium]